MKKIILTTINARYTHSAIGLRYLYANLKELREDAEIQEYVLNENTRDIVEKILSQKPSIVGIGAYIWNAPEVKKVIDMLKLVSPKTQIVLGGPEASHSPFRVNFDNADYIIQGEGDFAFYELCKDLLNDILPSERIIKAAPADLSQIELPYKYYTDHDIANRNIYVEASRGCPFTCEFCLSSIDKSVRYFDTDTILGEFNTLWERGARKFKFIDRTFNLNIKTTNRILDFFLEKEPPYLAHFEMVPEHFPERLKERISKFPPASLQLEVGIQTLNPEVADNISRKLNFEKIKENLHFLGASTHAHLHVDLIVGLPGETIESFAKNLNLLATLTNSEIQIGILKKLSGTSLCRHDQDHQMVYSNEPPYEILKNDLIDFAMMQKMKRFARFWDLTYNSGNFFDSIRMLWPKGDVYTGFYDFSEWLFGATQSTYQISLKRLVELIFTYLTTEMNYPKSEVANRMLKDILRIKGRAIPPILSENATEIPEIERRQLSKINKRQIQHL